MTELIPTGQVDPDKLEIHPVADLFPLVEDAEFQALVEDIKRNGQQEPIVLDAACKVLLDGRRRLRACRKAGVEPRFARQLEEVSPIDLIISLNVRRRHMNESQRAMVAARLMPKLGEEAAKRRGVRRDIMSNLTGSHGGTARSQAAGLLNVSPTLVQYAANVLKSGKTDLIRAVDTGELKVSTAARKLRPPRPTPQPAPAAVVAGDAMLLLWGPPGKLAEVLPAIENSGLKYRPCRWAEGIEVR